jgi:hypothetical protein
LARELSQYAGEQGLDVTFKGVTETRTGHDDVDEARKATKECPIGRGAVIQNVVRGNVTGCPMESGGESHGRMLDAAFVIEAPAKFFLAGPWDPSAPLP